MAEPLKGRKLTLRELLDQIAEDEEFSDEERELAREKVREIEYKAWCKRQLKASGKEVK
jgi:hypothetical protein